MDKFRSLYIDKGGQVFVGEEFQAEDLESARAANVKVLEDIADIDFIQICEVIEEVTR